ncbi:MAG: hypothetical protein ACLP22_02105 [Solirubrobacteraceae bacterium]
MKKLLSSALGCREKASLEGRVSLGFSRGRRVLLVFVFVFVFVLLVRVLVFILIRCLLVGPASTTQVGDRSPNNQNNYNRQAEDDVN